MSRLLGDLEPGFRLKAFELLARCTEAGIPVRIIETLRTREQQAINLKNGVSWTVNSRHLVGRAIDIAPTAVLAVKGWDPGHPLWLRIGEMGERIGLVWGGRWKQRDMCHFEMPGESA